MCTEQDDGGWGAGAFGRRAAERQHASGVQELRATAQRLQAGAHRTRTDRRYAPVDACTGRATRLPK